LEKAYSEGVEIQNHYDDKISHFFLVRGIEYDLNQLRIKEFLKAVNKRFRINLINLWEREFSKKSLAAKGLSDNQVASLLFARKELSNLPEKIAVAASGLTKVQQMEMHNLKKIKLSLKIATSQLSIQEVILTFATMMVGYTLYYNNSIDFRGRVYPVE
jgi:DNA-directed RNA polymerase